uniref:Retrovirus-related Pol polyprotein from transposon TNT 1-94 n=1 Tax=Cajanus cajan TaxID=3821 RepID=A0A151UBX7_CAJCA|nr:Retrovirus-related Pol polyprotein from transposon TNT 1-94 [Cajanus cajan]
MGNTKYDIEKFSGENDFGLWRIKMEAILIQQGCAEAIKGEEKMPSSLTQKEKTNMIEKAKSAIILCLGDKALKEVAREKTVAAITKSIVDQSAEFNKILDDLKNIEVQLEDEDKALLLLNSLLRNFEHFKDAILYGKEQDITLDEVQTSIRTKELKNNGLFVLDGSTVMAHASIARKWMSKLLFCMETLKKPFKCNNQKVSLKKKTKSAY